MPLSFSPFVRWENGSHDPTPLAQQPSAEERDGAVNRAADWLKLYGSAR